MKLITEVFHNIKCIEEAKEDKKELYIEGIFMQSDVANKNGRIYPSKVLDKEVDRYVNEYIKTKRSLGELNHPDGPIIDPAKASHLITSLRKEGTNYYGKAKVLNTPMGNVVKGLLEGGVQLGVSSRGMGSLKPIRDGRNEVQDDYVLSTVDIVSDPSAPKAFVNGIMEGVDWVYENGKWSSRDLTSYYKDIEKSKREHKEKAMLEAFKDFIQGLK